MFHIIGLMITLAKVLMHPGMPFERNPGLLRQLAGKTTFARLAG
jgi:hypothetical protein